MLNSPVARRAGISALTLCAAGALISRNAVAQQAAPPKPALNAARPAPTPPAPVKLPANIVARVNGQEITRDQALAVFDMVNGRPIVGQMVQNLILENEAKRLGITVTDAELNKAVQDAKDRVVANQMQQGGTPMTFNDIAAREGVREDLIRYSVHLDLLRRKTFMKSMESMMPALTDQIKLEHLLIATIPLGPEANPTPPADQAKKDEEAKTKIAGILADIKAGKTTFEEAAKKYSDDKSNAADGGALPWAGKGMFDPEFEKAAFAMTKSGEVVGPVKSQFGWHLIKLVSRGSTATAAEKAAYRKEQTDRIAQQAQNPQAVQQWFSSIAQNAKVEVNTAVRLVPTAKSPAATVFPAPARKTASR